MRTIAKLIEINGEKQFYAQKTINGESCLVPIPELSSESLSTVGELIKKLQTLNPDDAIYHQPSGNFPRITSGFIPSCNIIQYYIENSR